MPERETVSLPAAGISPPEALAEVAEHLGWQAPFLADEQRLVYRLLGLGRAPARQVYSPGTLGIYAKAAAHGNRPSRPVEDTRQLGGDGLLADGVLIRRWRPASPDDRIDPAALVTEATELLAAGVAPAALGDRAAHLESPFGRVVTASRLGTPHSYPNPRCWVSTSRRTRVL